ncbi:MAG: hypothetical protein JXA64_06015 [Candidatus Fermentibacteraceae bacterium]|nr:hypothetical protein [Candidatus Fermentibacteraceae bacterium]MBN2608652.1 hypothetical protein [Candidatus Fermentibacteraceae bacterium]
MSWPRIDSLREHLDYHKSRLPDYYENLQHLEGIEEDSLRAQTRRMNVDFWCRLTRMLVEWSDSALERVDSSISIPE